MIGLEGLEIEAAEGFEMTTTTAMKTETTEHQGGEQGRTGGESHTTFPGFACGLGFALESPRLRPAPPSPSPSDGGRVRPPPTAPGAGPGPGLGPEKKKKTGDGPSIPSIPASYPYRSSRSPTVVPSPDSLLEPEEEEEEGGGTRGRWRQPPAATQKATTTTTTTRTTTTTGGVAGKEEQEREEAEAEREEGEGEEEKEEEEELQQQEKETEEEATRGSERGRRRRRLSKRVRDFLEEEVGVVKEVGMHPLPAGLSPDMVASLRDLERRMREEEAGKGAGATVPTEALGTRRDEGTDGSEAPR